MPGLQAREGVGVRMGRGVVRVVHVLNIVARRGVEGREWGVVVLIRCSGSSEGRELILWGGTAGRGTAPEV